jgi:phosphogluconate 2-dehydrogenase
MRIALDAKYKQVVTNQFAGHEVVYYDGRTATWGAIREQLQGAEVLGMRKAFAYLDRANIEALPRLQFIHKSGSGTDWFDVEALSENGILLANNSGFNASSVAEHAVLLTLLCLRNTFAYLADLRAGIWRKTPPPGDTVSLEGKTVGIVGLGQIGSHVARRVLAFGTRVLATQRHQWPGAPILAGVEWRPLDELLREADLVILCVPLSAETERLMGRRELGLMKPTASLVNCSRGKVLDEIALYEALVGRRLRAAGLDVFAEEPTPADNPLLQLENVFATPHIGGHSLDLEDRQFEGALENLQLFVAGRRPLRLVNPEILERGSARATHLCKKA